MNYKKTIVAVTLAQLFAASAVMAQATTKPQAEPIETISVTGSRIKSFQCTNEHTNHYC